MSRRHAAAAAAFALVVAAAAGAQDSVALAAPRALPSVDSVRVAPFERHYDIVVLTRDSTFVVGQRALELKPAAYAGSEGWLLLETRTGIVPAVESLFVSPDLRPLRWAASLGAARLGVAFTRDSLFGATTAPGGRRSIVVEGRADLLVSSPMTEAILSALPLHVGRLDSLSVLALDLAETRLLPAALIALGEEALEADGLRWATWVVALRSEATYVLFWVDQTSGAVRRVQHALPQQGGAVMEYRFRPELASVEPRPPNP